MTATALISRGGRAVVRDGEAYYLLTADDPSPVTVNGTYWTHLRGLSPNSELIPAGRHPFTAVSARMIELWSEQLGLDLLLMVLDRDHDDAFRCETCVELESFFGRYPALVESLRALLLSIETPPEADLAGALLAARAAGAKQVQAIFTEMSEAGAQITAVLSAWRDARATVPVLKDQAEALRVSAQLRAVGRVVVGLRDPAPDAWARLRAWFRLNFEPALAETMAHGPALIDRWLAPLREGRPAAPTRVRASTEVRTTKAPAFLFKPSRQSIAA